MSIEAIRAALAEARELIAGAYEHGRTARDRLGEAIGGLTELSRSHPESLVPPEFPRADEQLATGMELLAGTIAVLDEFAAGL
jgi:hypothetical protein